MAIVGAALVLIAVFMPVLNAPIVGGIAYNRLVEDWYLPLILALVGAGLSLASIRWGALVTGILIGLDTAYVFTTVESRISSIPAPDSNPFALALARSVSPGMAFAFLGVGVLLLALSPFFFKEEVVRWNPTRVYDNRPAQPAKANGALGAKEEDKEKDFQKRVDRLQGIFPKDDNPKG